MHFEDPCRRQQGVSVLGSGKHDIGISQNHGNLVNGFNSPEIATIIDGKSKETLSMTAQVRSQANTSSTSEASLSSFGFFPIVMQLSANQKLIDTAQKTIRIAMFTWTRRDLAFRGTLLPKQRGVDVEVVIDYNSGRGIGATDCEDI